MALCASLSLLLSGCVHDNVLPGEQSGQKVLLQVRAQTIVGGIVSGVKIDKVRLILFDRNNNLVLNSTTSNGTLVENSNEQFTLDVETGSYQFVAVVNETPELTVELNAVKSHLHIEQIKSIWQTGTFTDLSIPLVNYGTLEVSAGSTAGQGVGRVTEFDASGPNTSLPTSPITITLPRALAKVSLFMRKGDVTTEQIDITQVELVNIPTSWYLLQTEVLQTDNISLFTGHKIIESGSGDTEYKGKKYHDIVPSGCPIPEKYFEPYSGSGQNMGADEANAAYLLIKASFGGIPTSYKVIIKEADLNFRLLRNTNYNVYVTVSNVGSKGIYATIEPVKMHEIAVNWQPVEGLVVVSDREEDFDKNINVWSDYTVYSSLLKVYKGEVYSDVLFKYGSLLALDNDKASSVAKPFVPPTNVTITNDVIWYPGAFNVMSVTDYPSVPYISDGSSFTAGNTPTDVALGKGDPCRLASLTMHQIGVEGRIDNQQWHMATPAEYAILTKASNGAGSENNDGYRSFHELLIPNVKYRDQNGSLTASHNNHGHYWSTEASQALSFNSLDLSQTTFQASDPQQAYTVRCVRNTIPGATFTFGQVPLIYYYGTETDGTSFRVSSNVPYWKLELVKSGPDKGTSNDFDDFSFAPFTSGVTHTIEGSYASTPKLYIKRKESRTEDRTFVMRFTSIHFNGEEHTYLFTIKQSRFHFKGNIVIRGIPDNKWLPGEAAKYTLHLDITPKDVVMPAGEKLTVRYSYLGQNIVESTEAFTSTGTYDYDVELDIPANNTPDEIMIVLQVFMGEGSRRVEIGKGEYYQRVKK